MVSYVKRELKKGKVRKFDKNSLNKILWQIEIKSRRNMDILFGFKFEN